MPQLGGIAEGFINPNLRLHGWCLMRMCGALHKCVGPWGLAQICGALYCYKYVGHCLSEDPSLTTFFFLGALGWGDGDSQVCLSVVVDVTLDYSSIL